MTDCAEAALDVPDPEVTEKQCQIKRHAVRSLLAWGFEPATISLLLGCSTDWIDSIAARAAAQERHPLT